MKKSSLFIKLTGAFLVPVLFLILLGITSYNSAAKTIVKKYEETLQGTMSAFAMYTDQMCDNVESRALEVVNDENFTMYYVKYHKKSNAEAAPYIRGIKDGLQKIQGTTSYVKGFHVFAEEGSAFTSGSYAPPADAYNAFLEAEGKAFEDGGNAVWMGRHPYLDGVLQTREEDYGISYIRKFIKKNGFLVFDISYESIIAILEDMQLGEGSVAVLVTADGREIRAGAGTEEIPAQEGKGLFYNNDFFLKALEKDENAGSGDVLYAGKEYVFVYGGVGDTGMYLCCLVPRANIVGEVEGIKWSTLFTVVAACLVCLFVGMVMAKGISGMAKKVSASMGRVSDGDFTAVVHTKRRDEFGVMAEAIKSALRKMCGLLGEVKHFAGGVSDTARLVAGTADGVKNTGEEIEKAVTEMTQGVTEQVAQADMSLKMMSGLAESVNNVYDDTEKMKTEADVAGRAVAEGRTVIDELDRKTREAADVTGMLIAEMDEVKEQSDTIGSLVKEIHEIAEQTNLLSLNASIEAARAGQAGAGFAVVADEIRKLADQSAQAGKRVKEIAENIHDTSEKTAVTAGLTRENMRQQSEALGRTIEVFDAVNRHVEELVHKLESVAVHMEHITIGKDEVLKNIKEISEVSETAAAFTQEIMAAMHEQVNAIKTLSEEAERLSGETQGLDAMLNRFVIEKA